MFEPIYVGSTNGHYVIDSDGQAQALTAGPTDGSEVGMNGDAFNALVAQRQKSFAALTAARAGEQGAA